MSFGPMDVRGLCIKCTVDTRNKSESYVYSSVFRFQGSEWSLFYRYKFNHHILGIWKKTDLPTVDPFDVRVQLECSGRGRIETILPQVTTRITDDRFESLTTWPRIWERREADILRSVPEFRLYKILKFILVLKPEEGDPITPAGTHSTGTQTECSVLEAAGQSGRTTSTSVQVQTTRPVTTTPCLESLSDELAQLLAEGSGQDVVFQCGGQSTRAHKLIVCKRSPVIASMLATDMVEGRTGVVTIPDKESDIFRQFMRYLYSGQLGELTFYTALRLYEAGDQYAVHSLTKRCREFLMEHLSTDNACEVLVVADFHSDQDLAGEVIDFMVEKRFPRRSDHWADFSDEHPRLANKVLDRAWDVFGD